jgi:hypothetical protein
MVEGEEEEVKASYKVILGIFFVVVMIFVTYVLLTRANLVLG